MAECLRSNVAIISQNVSQCTSINNQTNFIENEVKIYPNPSNGILNIILPFNAQVIITNQLGEVLINELLQTRESLINIKDLPNGIYFVKVLDDSKVQIIKIIKNDN